MTKILLDTDIGTDVDDAVCLAYLLANPQCELLGITTVTGEPEKRAALASVLTRTAGRDVTIFPGAGSPMRGAQKQPVAQQAAALPRWPHTAEYPSGRAVSFMADTIRKNPGEIYLLTIGPLTNAGLLFSEHPDIPGLLKGLVLMGGIFTEGYPEKDRVEWNIAGDPVASEIVYQARPPLHRSVGLDVTQQVVLPAEQVRQTFAAPLLAPVLDFAEIWFAQFFPSITFHDPLAAATIFVPDLCVYQQGEVRIDQLESLGRTVFSSGGAGAPHQVAVGVDVPRYFEHFFSIFR